MYITYTGEGIYVWDMGKRERNRKRKQTNDDNEMRLIEREEREKENWLTISPTNSEGRSSCLTIHKQFNI